MIEAPHCGFKSGPKTKEEITDADRGCGYAMVKARVNGAWVCPQCDYPPLKKNR